MNKKPTISLTMINSTGAWLRGALIPQHKFLQLAIEDDQGRIVAHVAMTMDQFTHMLVSNMSTECTLTRYRDDTGKLVVDKIDPPQTIEDKMKDRMKEYRTNLGTRMNDIHKDIYEMMNSGVKPGKKKLEELLRDIEVVRNHFKANEDFVMQQTQEELAQMQDNMRAQLSSYLQGIGANISKEDIKLFGDPNAPKLIESESVKPVLEPYQKKEREEKTIEDMTAREVADQIRSNLRRIEILQIEILQKVNDEKSHLFLSSASDSGNKKVNILYINYQGTNSIPLEEAKKYLAFLRKVKDINDFKTHWHYDKENNNL